MNAPLDPRNRRLGWLRYPLACALLVGILIAVPAAEIWGVLELSRPVPLIAAMAILLVGRLVASLRTKALTDGQDLSFSVMRLFEISCASTFYGLALPGSFSGGVVRWYRLSHPTGNRSGALAAVVSERIVDFLVLALFGLFCLAADARPGRPGAVAWVLLAASGICLAITLFAFTGQGSLSGKSMEEISKRLRFLPEAVSGALSRFADAFAAYRDLGRSRLALLFGISALFHGLLTVSQYLMAVSLSLEISLITICWVRAFTTFVTALPLTPSGLGIREVSLVMLLMPLGVSAAQAVAFSLLQFSGLLLIALVGAVFDIRRYLQP